MLVRVCFKQQSGTGHTSVCVGEVVRLLLPGGVFDALV
jgi:hypothetical protein